MNRSVSFHARRGFLRGVAAGAAALYATVCLHHKPAVLACLVLVLVGADWPRFRGPDGAGISDAKGLPTTFSDTENLAWKTELPGPGSSSPIVVGDRIFVTCFTGYGVDRARIGRPEDLKRILLCVDSKSDQVVWQRLVDAYLPEDSSRGMLADHGFASSTPASDGERVYVLFGKSGVWWPSTWTGRSSGRPMWAAARRRWAWARAPARWCTTTW